MCLDIEEKEYVALMVIGHINEHGYYIGDVDFFDEDSIVDEEYLEKVYERMSETLGWGHSSKN